MEIGCLKEMRQSAISRARGIKESTCGPSKMKQKQKIKETFMARATTSS